MSDLQFDVLHAEAIEALSYLDGPERFRRKKGRPKGSKDTAQRRKGGGRKKSVTLTERNTNWCEEHLAGKSFTEIARAANVSRERVRQVVFRDTGRRGMERVLAEGAKRRAARADAKAAAKEARRLKRVERVRPMVEARAREGLTYEELGKRFGMPTMGAWHKLAWAVKQPEFRDVLVPCVSTKAAASRKPEHHAEIIGMVKRGMKQKDIAALVGVHRSVIADHVAREKRQ